MRIAKPSRLRANQKDTHLEQQFLSDKANEIVKRRTIKLWVNINDLWFYSKKCASLFTKVPNGKKKLCGIKKKFLKTSRLRPWCDSMFGFRHTTNSTPFSLQKNLFLIWHFGRETQRKKIWKTARELPKSAKKCVRTWHSYKYASKGPGSSASTKFRLKFSVCFTFETSAFWKRWEPFCNIIMKVCDRWVRVSFAGILPSKLSEDILPNKAPWVQTLEMPEREFLQSHGSVVFSRTKRGR